MKTTYLTSEDLKNIIENEAKFKVDSFVSSAFELAEEVHKDVKREDGTTKFLESHIYPVTAEVIRHYISHNKVLTTLQIVSSLLHDVMEDNERILDLHVSHDYGFDAYFEYEFGNYVCNVLTTIKVKPLENFDGLDTQEQRYKRFQNYCETLLKATYDIKTIKLVDRMNNMNFMLQCPEHEKVNRYLREAEDFFIAYTLVPPTITDFYYKIREVYETLQKISANSNKILTKVSTN